MVETGVLKTGKSNDEFWIDFWVICDGKNAHLFYSNQKSTVFRMQCPVERFPQGFTQAKEQAAMTMKGEDEYGPWQIFEAQHIYHVKKPDKFRVLEKNP